jgi:hypothetical protein
LHADELVWLTCIPAHQILLHFGEGWVLAAEATSAASNASFNPPRLNLDLNLVRGDWAGLIFAVPQMIGIP